MLPIENIPFYVIFLSQVLLLSLYFPGKLLSQIRYVLETCPPEEYPNLYPEPIEKYEKAQRIYRAVNFLILLAGLFLMVVLLNDSSIGDWNGVVTTYFMVQFLPMLLLEIGSFKYYLLMRTKDSRTMRKAELQPRRLFDFISPALFGAAIFVYLGFAALIIYIRQFGFTWFGGYWNIVGITAANLFFAGIIIWNIYGKKQDPYQTNRDRMRRIERTVKSLVYISMAATVFVAINVVLASVELRHLQPPIVSLYLQVIGVISFRALRLDDIDFAVYKKDQLATSG